MIDKILTRIRNITTDVDGHYWTDTELKLLIDDAQEEYCRETRSLRSEAPLTTRENSEIYNLPLDCYEVLRLERADGHVLKHVTSDHLQRIYGSHFRSCKGEPCYFYQDLDNEDQLRFFPSPSLDIRATFIPFDQEEGALVQVQDDLGADIPFDQEEGAVVDTDGESIFDQNEGVVSAFLSTDSAYKVFYIRRPQEGVVEIKDQKALAYYVSSECFRKEGPFNDLKRVEYYKQKFEERVIIERQRVNNSFGASHRVQGNYC